MTTSTSIHPTHPTSFKPQPIDSTQTPPTRDRYTRLSSQFSAELYSYCTLLYSTVQATLCALSLSVNCIVNNRYSNNTLYKIDSENIFPVEINTFFYGIAIYGIAPTTYSTLNSLHSTDPPHRAAPSLNLQDPSSKNPTKKYKEIQTRNRERQLQ